MFMHTFRVRFPADMTSFCSWVFIL